MNASLARSSAIVELVRRIRWRQRIEEGEEEEGKEKGD